MARKKKKTAKRGKSKKEKIEEEVEEEEDEEEEDEDVDYSDMSKKELVELVVERDLMTEKDAKKKSTTMLMSALEGEEEEEEDDDEEEDVEEIDEEDEDNEEEEEDDEEEEEEEKPKKRGRGRPKGSGKKKTGKRGRPKGSGKKKGNDKKKGKRGRPKKIKIHKNLVKLAEYLEVDISEAEDDEQAQEIIQAAINEMEGSEIEALGKRVMNYLEKWEFEIPEAEEEEDDEEEDEEEVDEEDDEEEDEEEVDDEEEEIDIVPLSAFMETAPIEFEFNKKEKCALFISDRFGLMAVAAMAQQNDLTSEYTDDGLLVYVDKKKDADDIKGKAERKANGLNRKLEKVCKDHYSKFDF